MEIIGLEKMCGRLRSLPMCTCPFCLWAISQRPNANSS